MPERDPAQISPLQTQIMQQLTQGQGQGVYGAPDAFDFTSDPKAQGMAPADTFDFEGEVTALEPSYKGSSVAGDAGDTAELWEWRKRVEDGKIKDAFDFQPQLTSEPTAPEGGHVRLSTTPPGPCHRLRAPPGTPEAFNLC